MLGATDALALVGIAAYVHGVLPRVSLGALNSETAPFHGRVPHRLRAGGTVSRVWAGPVETLRRLKSYVRSVSS